MSYVVRLAVSAQTPIMIENVKLNQADAAFENCVARVLSSNGSDFSYLYNCGDGALQDYLRDGSLPLRIVSMRPNPVDDVLVLETESRSDVQVQIIDPLGRMMRERTGIKSFEIDTRSLSSGLYFVRVASADGSQVRSLVKR